MSAECQSCQGAGYVVESCPDCCGNAAYESKSCGRCDGTGHIELSCHSCDGKGGLRTAYDV